MNVFKKKNKTKKTHKCPEMPKKKVQRKNITTLSHHKPPHHLISSHRIASHLIS